MAPEWQFVHYYIFLRLFCLFYLVVFIFLFYPIHFLGVTVMHLVRLEIIVLSAVAHTVNSQKNNFLSVSFLPVSQQRTYASVCVLMLSSLCVSYLLGRV